MAAAFRNCILGSLLVGTLFSFPPAKAQEISNLPAAPFFIRSWQNQQGLPNNTVNAVAQTRDGYLWLGTDAGLARFDGEHCRVLGLPEGLGSLQISALLEDHRGALWIGTAGGGLSRLMNGVIETFTTKDGLAGNSIQALIEAGSGEVWAGTPTGLSRWHDGRFEPLASSLGSMYVTDLARDQQGDIWVATLHNGLLRFSAANTFTNSRPTGALRLVNFSPRCVLVDNQNRVWVGARDKCVYCLDQGNWTRFGTNDGLPEIVLNRLAQTPDGTIWAASINEGLHYVRAGRFHALQRKDGLSDDAILSLFCDGQFLWAGTQSGGLCRIGPKKLSVYHPMAGLSECQLRSLAETTNGEIWLGTYGQGLYHWQAGQIEQLPGTPWQDHVIVEALLGGRDGSLWWGAGPGLYQWQDGKLLSRYDERLLAGDRIWCLCEDRNEGLWFGTYNGQLQFLKQKKFTAIKGLPARPVTALAQAPDGTLWIGSLGGGLGRWQNGRLTLLTTKDGLQSDLVRALLLDADGTLWIGTDGGGLNRWSQGQMHNFTTEQGLPDNSVLQILEDDDGNLWLGGNHGICRVSKRVLNDVAAGRTVSLHLMNCGMSEGMASEQCVGNFGAALKTRSGQLCFATAKGIVVIDPRQPTHVATLPVAAMEDVFVDKQLLKNPPATMPLPAAPTQGKAFNGAATIPAGRHSFDFHFTGIAFDAPEKIQFRYWLEGLDSGWTEWGDIRVAHYSYVPPGTYRFHVQASNLNGQWNEPGTGMALVVLPYFWQTLWFQVLSVVGMVGLIAAGIRLVERRRYRARLKRIEQEQTMERERVRIARDLHDELGSSLTYISMSITDIGQSKENSAEQLKARVEQISNFAVRTARALDEIVWAVNPRNDSLRSLVEYLTQLARELFENTEAHCRFQIADNLPEVPLPPEMRHHLFLVVKEALNNALKYAHATEISLSAKTIGQQFEICLHDNGDGFDLATVSERNERNGLDNMRHRIEALGGRFSIQTKPGQGTTIKLTVAYPRGHAAGTKPVPNV